MSKFTDILANIGQALGMFNFEDVKDATGNLIRIEKYEVGGKVNLISTDGSLVELPDGEYTLEDGRAFNVTGGTIATITADAKAPDATEEVIQPIANAEATENVSDEPAATEEEPVKPEMGGRMDELEARVAELEQALTDAMNMMTEMASQTSSFKDVKKKLEKQKEELNARVAELESTPAGDPVIVKASKIENKPEDVSTFITPKGYAFSIPNKDYAQLEREFQANMKSRKNK